MSVHDIIELSYLVADEQIVLTIEDSECRQRQIVIEKHTDEELGLEFEAAVFDGVTTCYNNCVFCFVDQMIPGMRESLYVRDDDYRLALPYSLQTLISDFLTARDSKFRNIHIRSIAILLFRQAKHYRNSETHFDSLAIRHSG